MAKPLQPGIDDLQTTHPQLALTWHPTLNIGVTPSEISAGTAKKYWWLCEREHSWEASAASRKLGSGCPYCSNNRVLAGFNDLETTNPELAKSFHPSRNSPVSPSEIFAGSQKKYWWTCHLGHEWEASVGSRNTGVGCPYCQNLKVLAGFNDLSTTNPELISSWNIALNLPESPSTIVVGSSQKRWWDCANGHLYAASPHNRSLGKGCPVCAGKVVESGSNDLASNYPKIALSWHPTKNLPARPDSVGVGTSRKYWWVCDAGHEWRASAASRTGKKSGCPTCANQNVLSGFNDLATTNPHLIETWHPTKNLPKVPSELSAGSSTKYWWICKQGHEWVAAPHTRAKGIGCPYCSGRYVLSGLNDMATTHPELVATWHPSKNLPATPHMVSAGTPRQFWWRCPEGHEWRTAPAARSKAGTGCPRCANYGFDATRESVLYFIENVELGAFKVGIMNSSSTRLARFKDTNWNVIQTWSSESGVVIRDAETKFFKHLRNVLEIPAHVDANKMGSQGGHSETFSNRSMKAHEVASILERLLAEASGV